MKKQLKIIEAKEISEYLVTKRNVFLSGKIPEYVVRKAFGFYRNLFSGNVRRPRHVFTKRRSCIRSLKISAKLQHSQRFFRNLCWRKLSRSNVLKELLTLMGGLKLIFGKFFLLLRFA